jgi:hypothetical protein
MSERGIVSTYSRIWHVRTHRFYVSYVRKVISRIHLSPYVPVILCTYGMFGWHITYVRMSVCTFVLM